jgi:hypothetical protein
MLKMRLVPLILLAGFLFSAATAATAAATTPEWWVEGNPIAKEETISETVNLVKHFVITSAKATIECSGMSVKKGYIKSKTENGAEALVFKGCEATVSKITCKVKNSGGKAEGAIETGPVSVTLENPKEEKEDNKLNFKPSVGESFATVEGTCLSKSEGGLVGFMNCNYLKVETEADEHRLEFTEKSSKITIGGEAAHFTGEAGITLSSNKLWSVKF